MKVNVNQSVKVKLTEEGLRVYCDYWKQFVLPHNIPAPPVESDGYAPFQLWALMSVFGPHLQIGGPVLFADNEIIIEQ